MRLYLHLKAALTLNTSSLDISVSVPVCVPVDLHDLSGLSFISLEVPLGRDDDLHMAYGLSPKTSVDTTQAPSLARPGSV